MDGRRVHALLQRAVLFALLEELDTTPKPGLVDRHDSGAHTDMDYALFVRSAQAVAPRIAEMGVAGFTWEDDPERLFPTIQAIGVEAEGAMYGTTGGVNTHKGAVFTLGILGAATGFAMQGGGSLEPRFVLQTARRIAEPWMLQALHAVDKKKNMVDAGTLNPATLTHGEQVYCTHGIRGVRWEAAQGFPAVAYALGTLSPSMLNSPSGHLNTLKLDVLLRSMAYLDDTNLLSRGGKDGLELVKREASAMLSLGGASSPGGLARMMALNDLCIRRNLSPGGSADTLAAALFLLRVGSPDFVMTQED